MIVARSHTIIFKMAYGELWDLVAIQLPLLLKWINF